jgi:hypothetical protein
LWLAALCLRIRIPLSAGLRSSAPIDLERRVKGKTWRLLGRQVPF